MTTRQQTEARESPSGIIWTVLRSWKGPGAFVTVVVRSTAGATRYISGAEWDSWEAVA